MKYGMNNFLIFQMRIRKFGDIRENKWDTEYSLYCKKHCFLRLNIFSKSLKI